ncbi:hypothetical protein HAX54_003352 [Datura stramonium]|uniref:Uncharacterized protein n=1 Tax=Datura stramonium TaxID=4076 RepID=A0ABS8T577_DATST|nr:hypothetical protein [Datura stramonium]
MVEAKELHKGAGGSQVEEVEEQWAPMKKWEASAEKWQCIKEGGLKGKKLKKREEMESRTGVEDGGTEAGGRRGDSTYRKEEQRGREKKVYTRRSSQRNCPQGDAEHLVDDDGSRGPSITAMVGTASSSSNSL